MKVCSKSFAVGMFAATLFLAGCGGVNTGGTLSAPPVTILVSPNSGAVAAGATVTFTAATTGTSAQPTWVLLESNGVPAASALGSLGSASGNSITYTAPATPPIYTDSLGLVQGSVLLQASVPDPKTGNPAAQIVTFAITTPSVTMGISPTTATVALGTTLTVYAYAVGSANNAITMQVNGVTGGAAATGTIAQTAGASSEQFTYTAPATKPMSGDTVTVTAVSGADPTKAATLVVTLQ